MSTPFQVTPAIEREPSTVIDQFQEEKLLELLRYLNEKSPFYQNKFKREKIDWQKIKSLEDLQLISVTTKEDLQQHNSSFLCVPPDQVRDYVTTSGTLGNPVTFALTDADLDRLAYNEKISFQCAGVQAGDVVQLMTTLDRKFMAGLAYFLGLRLLGASCVRVGAGIPQLHWDSIVLHQPKYLVAVPSFILKMIAYAEQNNIDYHNSSVRAIICIGEPLRTPELEPSVLALRIQEKWKVALYSTYASTEMSTAFTECHAFAGGHQHPELIITEVLNTDNQPVKKGERGELTITTLGVEGMPLLRFKTGDLVQKHEEVCTCGRTTPRIGPVEGRTQHMIKYKGTTLFPPVLHEVLGAFEDILLYQIELTTTALGTDALHVRLHIASPKNNLLEQIKDVFRAKLRVVPTLEQVSLEELQKLVFPPMSRKPINFIDKR